MGRFLALASRGKEGKNPLPGRRKTEIQNIDLLQISCSTKGYSRLYEPRLVKKFPG
jgi:hypothetical protein